MKGSGNGKENHTRRHSTQVGGFWAWRRAAQPHSQGERAESRLKGAVRAVGGNQPTVGFPPPTGAWAPCALCHGPRRTERTCPGGHRLRTAKDPAGCMEGAGSPAAGPRGESGGHHHGRCEEAPFPHPTSQEAVYTKTSRHLQAARPPWVPWSAPEGGAGRGRDEGSRCMGRLWAQ